MKLGIAGTEGIRRPGPEMDAVYQQLEESKLRVKVSLESPSLERASYEGMLVGDWIPSGPEQLTYYIDSLSNLQFDSDGEINVLLEVQFMANAGLSQYMIEPRLVAGGREFS